MVKSIFQFQTYTQGTLVPNTIFTAHKTGEVITITDNRDYNNLQKQTIGK